MNNKKERVAFLTLGCKVNTYETNAMQLLFREAGYQIVEFSEQADIYIVNTCSVTNMADRKSRQMLHRAKKNNPDSIVVAVGCYVQSAKEALEQDDTVDVVIGNNQKHLVVEEIENYKKDHSQRALVTDVWDNPGYEKLQIADAGERTRAFLKIQDGCNQFCSYCIIPYARGKVRSRQEDDILEEIRALTQKGYKEFVLNGIHLSSYGADWENKDFVKLEGKPLLHLLKQINAIEGVERIRLGSLEPRIITETFVSELSGYEKVCPHFHLSLQSGCDETLKRMNRKYTTTEYEEGCKVLRKFYEHPAITTDVIVGFPGETEEEFSATREFVGRIGFSKMHIFKFSVRKGTKAEKMKPQIQEQIKTQRSNVLLSLDEQLQAQYQALFLGKTVDVLFEESTEIEGKRYMVGHTEQYLKIAVEETEETAGIANQIRKVLLTEKLAGEILLGKIG